MPDLIIAGLTIPLEALGEPTQSYETLGGRSEMVMSDGSLFRQTSWEKLATTLRGNGWAPPGLHSISYTTAVELRCIGQRAIAGATPVITLPAARRSDVAPFGQAVVNGRIVPTPLALVGNVATLTAVAGASGYRVLYYPQITAWVTVTEDTDVHAAGFGWTLTAREA